MIVLNVNVAGLESCFPGSKANRDRVFGNRDRPEQPAVGDPRIEVVNLLTRRVKYIESYKGERAMVIAPVRSDELTDHEAHVSFKVKVLRSFTNSGVGSHAAHGCPSHETIEIRYCGRLDTGSR